MFLLALVAVTVPRSSFTQDEGAYALQAGALEDGAWAYRYKAAPLDPEGRWFPVALSTRGADGRIYPYVKHPAYPVLLRASAAVGGRTFGLHLVALLGAVAAAAAAWLLAGEVDAGLRRPAFWVAAASPVLVNGLLLWAHAPSAALGGFAVLAGARIARRGPTPLATAGVAAAVAGGVLLRSEGLLFAGALAVGVGIARYRGAGGVQGVLASGLVAAPAVLAVVVERRWVLSIVGNAVETLAVREIDAPTPYLSGRVSGAVHTLLQAHDAVPAAGLPVLAALGLVAGLGYVALRRWRDRSGRDLAVAAIAPVLLYGVRLLQHPTEPVTGLLAAWPLVLLGLLLLPRQRPPVLQMCLVTAGVFAAAVLLTQYPVGGGLEWGGRFLSPVTVPLAVVATAALAARLRAVPDAARMRATAAVAGMAAVTALFSLVAVRATRAEQDGFIAAADRHPAQVTVTTVAFYPRVAWRTNDRLTWMLADDRTLPDLLRSLRSQGVDDVVLVTRRDVPPSDLTAYADVRKVDEPVFDGAGATMLRLRG